MMKAQISTTCSDCREADGLWVSGRHYPVTLCSKHVQVDALVEALRFYADPHEWKNNEVDIGVGNLQEPESSEVFMDHGHRAQKALAAPADFRWKNEAKSP